MHAWFYNGCPVALDNHGKSSGHQACLKGRPEGQEVAGVRGRIEAELGHGHVDSGDEVISVADAGSDCSSLDERRHDQPEEKTKHEAGRDGYRQHSAEGCARLEGHEKTEAKGKR